MNTITEVIEVDIYEANATYVRANQANKKSRYLSLQLTQHGEPYTIPNGVVARIQGQRPDKQPILNDGTISGNTITFELTEYMLAVSGTADVEVALYDESNNAMITSSSFHLIIPSSPLDAFKIVNTSEFTTLINALNKVEKIINSGNEAIETFDQIKLQWKDMNTVGNQLITDLKQLKAETIIAKDEAIQVTEKSNQTNESVKIAEEQRVQAENIRIANENERITNENSRKSSFVTMETTFTEKITETTTATQNANQATTKANEATTLANQAAQNATNSSDAANELNKNVANAEAIRIENENGRITNEEKRQSDFTAKMAEASQAINTANQSAQDANGATLLANEATSKANAATEKVTAFHEQILQFEQDFNTIYEPTIKDNFQKSDENAKLAERYAVGRTDMQDSLTDNSKYYYEQAKLEYERAKNEADRAALYADIITPEFKIDPETMELIQVSKGKGIEFTLTEDKELLFKFTGGEL